MAQVQTRSLVVGNFRSRCSIVTTLQTAGFRVIEATECIRALKHLLDQNPHIVIIHEGKSLPNLIKLLRALRCLASTPILVVGSGNENSVVQSLLHGAEGYFPTSGGVESLSAYVHVLLSQN